MTESDDTTSSVERKFTDREIAAARQPAVALLRRERVPMAQAEDAVQEALLKMLEKHRNEPIRGSNPAALTMMLAKFAMLDAKGKEARHEDIRKQNPSAFEPSESSASDEQLEQKQEAERQRQWLEPLFATYAKRQGQKLTDAFRQSVIAQVDNRALVVERGELRKPGHFYEDERAALQAAFVAKCAKDWESYMGTPWTDRENALVRAMAEDSEKRTQRDRASNYLEKLNAVAREGLQLAREFPEVIHRPGPDRRLSEMVAVLEQLVDAASVQEPAQEFYDTIWTGEVEGNAALDRFVFQAVRHASTTLPDFGFSPPGELAGFMPGVNELTDMWTLAGNAPDPRTIEADGVPLSKLTGSARNNVRRALKEALAVQGLNMPPNWRPMPAYWRPLEEWRKHNTGTTLREHWIRQQMPPPEKPEAWKLTRHWPKVEAAIRRALTSTDPRLPGARRKGSDPR